MIDFRYHLISIVAVLLALSIGIVTGSGFLGGPLLERIKTQADRLTNLNRSLQEDVVANQGRADALEAALAALEPEIIDGTLIGEQIAMIEFQGSEEVVADGLAAAIEDAGGSVSSRIVLQEDLVLDDEGRREELRAMLDGAESNAADLRLLLAEELGQAMFQAATDTRFGASERLSDLLAVLSDAGYVSVETSDGSGIMPFQGSVVIAGGSRAAALFPVRDFAVALAARLGGRDGRVLVAESADSTWGLAAAIRQDAVAEESVWTVDNADAIHGRIAAALALDDAELRPVGHFGTDPGADAVVPQPPSG